MIPQATLHPGELEFHARVTQVHADGGVELSHTFFYPTGGGQPCDTGVLRCGTQEFRVTDVRKESSRIVHSITPLGLCVGDEIDGVVDAQRRMTHRRMHTAMHILCATLEREKGTKITGNQIGEEKSRLDVDLEHYEPTVFERAITQANTLITQDLPVARSVVSREEFLTNPSLVKLAAGFPEHITQVHLVAIQGVDAQACGGTHVDHLGEIGRIVLIKTENRGANRRRVYFRLE